MTHSYTFEVRTLNIPFKFSYEHNLAQRMKTDTSILILTLNNFICVGESAPRDYVTGETTGNMDAQIKKYLPTVIDQFDGSLISLKTALNYIPDTYPALRCLIESSLISYILQSTNTNIFDLFKVKSNLELSYTAPITGGSETMFQKTVQLAAHRQIKDIKLKINSSAQTNIERVKYLKKVCGDDIKIRMDGNEIWSYEQAKDQIPQLIDLGVSCFEQLFPREDIESYDKAFKTWGNSCEFIVDESITSVESAHQLIARKNVHGACLKIAKNGGLIQTIALANLLKEHDLSIRLGCHVGECSYLTLLGVVFASIHQPMDIEGALGTLLLDHDPFYPNIMVNNQGVINVDDHFKSTIGQSMLFKYSF